MPLIYTDRQIDAPVAEPKPLPVNYRQSIKFSSAGCRGRHEACEFSVTGSNGNEFVVKLRQSTSSPSNFSVIVGVLVPGTNEVFRLRRLNGDHGDHRNQIEKNVIRGFHIHQATERYQTRGMAEDSFAVATANYTDVRSALDHLIDTCGFIRPQTGPLFQEASKP